MDRPQRELVQTLVQLTNAGKLQWIRNYGEYEWGYRAETPRCQFYLREPIRMKVFSRYYFGNLETASNNQAVVIIDASLIALWSSVQMQDSRNRHTLLNRPPDYDVIKMATEDTSAI